MKTCFVDLKLFVSTNYNIVNLLLGIVPTTPGVVSVLTVHTGMWTPPPMNGGSWFGCLFVLY